MLLVLINATGGIGVGGVISLHPGIINDIEAGQLSATATWIVMIAIGVVAAPSCSTPTSAAGRAGLVAPPVSVSLLKGGAVLVAAVIVAFVANQNRGRFIVLQGMPWGVLLVLAILFVWTILLGRTRFGRYIYAIGGNTEAARRGPASTWCGSARSRSCSAG